jgi:hypothetical protein
VLGEDKRACETHGIGVNRGKTSTCSCDEINRSGSHFRWLSIELRWFGRFLLVVVVRRVRGRWKKRRKFVGENESAR